MASTASFRAWAKSLGRLSYYEILRVDRRATAQQIAAAFHAFALECHPDRHAGEGGEASALVIEVWKRGAEAYNILGKPPLRKRYDRGLARGRLRLDVDKRSTAPPPLAVRTLEMIARTPGAKKLAAKADRLLSVGKLDEARVQIVSALQQDPGNEELEERLTFVYEALVLEPP